MYRLSKWSPEKVLLPLVADFGCSRSHNKGRRRRRALILVLCVYSLWSVCTNIQAWLGTQVDPPVDLDVISQIQHPRPDLQNLILVACHAVFIGPDYTKAEDQSSWLLLDYQKVPGQAHSFVEHIQEGIAQAQADTTALLLFSGGQTRKAAGPRSEGEGYWLVAEAAGWWGHAHIRDRAFTEEHARDSFENVLFGLCRFHELTGHYPRDILVISYDFKHERFVDLHRAALHWPDHQFRFLGTPALMPGAQEAEQMVIEAFQQDPFGCSGALMAKKHGRDPFAVGAYSGNRCPGLGRMLDKCQNGITGNKGFKAPWD